MKQVKLESLKKFAFIPILIVVILLIFLAISGERVAPTNHLLLPIITMVFLTIPCLITAFLAARSFLATGSWQTLLFGCALLTFGAGNSVASWIQTPNGPNITITLGNISNLLASIFFIALAFLTSRTISTCRESKRRMALSVIYLGVMVIVALYCLLTIQGVTPAFYVPGTGPTVLRQIVLWSAAVLFGFSAIYFLWIYSRSRSDFLFWCSLGLGLMTAGFVANTFLSVFGDAINWLGRIGQYLGAVYLAMGIIALVRETRMRRYPMNLALADFFNQSRINYQILVDTIADAVVSLDRRGRILTWNRAAETIFGYQSSEAVGFLFMELLIPANRSADLKNQIDRLTSPDSSARLEKTETTGRRKNGDEFPVELSLATTNLGLNRFTTILVIRDISERKTAEESLKESEERYHNLFESMSEGFALCEMLYDETGKPVDYRFINVNPMIEKQFGLPRDQIIGKNIRAIIPNVQPKAIEYFANVLLTGKPIHFENYSRDLKRWFDVYSYRSGPDGSPICYLI